MIGILIVAHEPVASSFAKAVTHVLGQPPVQLDWLDVAPDARSDDVVKNVQKRIAAIDGGDGVLVCTDVCGATPCNISTQLDQPGKVHVLTGLNLPMLLRAVNYRNASLNEVTEKAMAGGKAGVMQMERGNASDED